MSRLLFILVITAGSVLAGYAFRVFSLRRGRPDDDALHQASKRAKQFALLVLFPFSITVTFWKLEPPAGPLLVLPLLGVAGTAAGAVASWLLIRLVRVPPRQAGSLFVCGMFSNFGILGGFVCFVLLGDPGFYAAQLFNAFVPILFFAVGFPVSAMIGRGQRGLPRLDAALLRDFSSAAVPLAAIVAGILLSAVSAPLPPLVERLGDWAIPATSGVLGLAIGATLHPASVGRYRREIGLVLAVKFLAIPAVVAPIALLSGLGDALGGAALSASILLAFMPVAFMATVPPAIYGFDLDLANAGWLTSTGVFIAMIPVAAWII
jgi:predicted permease